MKRLALVLLAVLGWSCLVRGSAVAAPRYLLVSDQATFTTSDGTTTLAYSLVNLTDRAATVSLSAAGSSCAFRPDSAALLPAREQKVTFTVTGCEPPTATSTTLMLKAGTASFEVTGAPGST